MIHLILGQLSSGMNEDRVLLPRHSAGAGRQEVALDGHHPHRVVRVQVPQEHSSHHVPDLSREGL